jgi:periplasmic protein TonB
MRLEAYALTTLLVLASAAAPAQSSATQDGNGQTPPMTLHAPAGPMRVSGGVIAGLLQHKVDPIYPEDAKAKGISGAVVLHAIIDQQGKIDKLSVISGPEALRDASLTAVRQWTYNPYMLNGRPRSVETTVTVNFTPAP